MLFYVILRKKCTLVNQTKSVAAAPAASRVSRLPSRDELRFDYSVFPSLTLIANKKGGHFYTRTWHHVLLPFH